MNDIEFKKIDDEELNMDVEGQFYFCSERCGGLPEGAILVWW